MRWSNSCAPGTWFGNFWVNTWGNGQVGYRYAGIVINAYCQAGSTVRMSFYAICTESPCSGSADIQVDATRGATSPPNRASAGPYHHCRHSDLSRALAQRTGMTVQSSEWHVHDVLNVFMCTGFTRDTGQYFMKASPVRPGDFIEFFAEIDLLGALSACPGGDCSSEHSSDEAVCHPLLVEVFRPLAAPAGWVTAPRNGYDRRNGL